MSKGSRQNGFVPLVKRSALRVELFGFLLKLIKGVGIYSDDLLSLARTVRSRKLQHTGERRQLCRVSECALQIRMGNIRLLTRNLWNLEESNCLIKTKQIDCHILV